MNFPSSLGRPQEAHSIAVMTLLCVHFLTSVYLQVARSIPAFQSGDGSVEMQIK